MTIAEKIIQAINEIITDREIKEFSRQDICTVIGISRKEFSNSFDPSFQGMRKNPGNAPKPRKEYQKLFEQVKHGIYQLTPYGRHVVLRETYSPNLIPGDTVTNKQISDIFVCSNQGGMRRSNRINALILISDPFKSIYQDRWINDVFHYTGMGLEGNQNLSQSQNATLAKSNELGVSIYLFEALSKKKYTYTGKVHLAEAPYQEIQLDTNNQERSVWIFPLVKEEPYFYNYSILDNRQSLLDEAAEYIDEKTLKKLAESSPSQPSTREAISTHYDRNPSVSEYTKRRAKGICELCGQPGPFENKGRLYLETHHIIWLSRNGEDTIENTVALCPNCHKKMHILDLEKDVQTLLDIQK